MELITKEKYKSIIGDSKKLIKIYSFNFEDCNYYRSNYRSNIYLLDKKNNIPMIYNISLEILLIPESYNITKSYLESIIKEKLTVEDWNITFLSKENKESYYINELERFLTYFRHNLLEIDESIIHSSMDTGSYRISNGKKEYNIELFKKKHEYLSDTYQYYIGVNLIRSSYLSPPNLEELDLLYHVIYIKYFIE